jgi:1-acyl-sn-glycerol-3-phosphate acyltransferase
MRKAFYRYIALFKSSIRLCLRIFYRRFEIRGVEAQVPAQGPVILAANHSNAFLDALIPAVWMPLNRQAMSITRSDVFNPRTDKLLRAFNMVPIYRFRDGYASLRNNDQTLDEVMQWFGHRDATLVIFPEGNHGPQRRLRPLQKGIARIAFQVLEQYPQQQDLVILPVGLYYSQRTHARGDMLAQVGEPLRVADFLPAYQAHAQKGYAALLEALSSRLRTLMVDIPDEARYEALDRLRAWFSGEEAARRGLAPGLAGELEAGRELLKDLQKSVESSDFQQFESDVQAYAEALAQAGLDDAALRQPVQPALALGARGLLLLAGLPLFAYGWLNHALPYALIQRLAARFRDDQFHGPVKFIAAWALFPLFYALQSLLALLLAGPPEGLAYLLSLPLSGWLALRGREEGAALWAAGRLRRHPGLRAQRKALYDKLLRMIA